MKKLVDHARVKERAEHYREDMTRFLRDLIKIGGESTEEKGKALRIKEEMEKVGFDKAEIDGLGNVYGWMGDGERIIALDAHIDTVGIGEIATWDFDPYEGYENETEIGGRKSAAAAHPIS